MRIPDVRVRKGQRARIAAFRRALRQGLVDDRRIVHIADTELQAAQLVGGALGIRHRDAEVDRTLTHGQVVFKAFGREAVGQLPVRIAQGQRPYLQTVTPDGHFRVPGQTFHVGHRQSLAHRILQTAKGHAVRIPDVGVREHQSARVAFIRFFRLALIDDRRVVRVADAEVQVPALGLAAIMLVRHRDGEVDVMLLTHGQVVQVVLVRREGIGQRVIRPRSLGVLQLQLPDQLAVCTIDLQCRRAALLFQRCQIHRQGGACRILQAFKGHAVRISGIHVRDDHGPGQGAGRLRDCDLRSVIAALDGDGDGLGDLVAGAVGDGDLVEALAHALTICQVVHVLRQLILVLAGLGIKVQGTVFPCDHLPDLAVDGHRLGALSRIMQRIAIGLVRAAIPAFGCDGLLCRGSRIFRHIDRQAPLVGYLRHAVASLDVDREFLFGDAAVAVIHHHGDLGIRHVRGTQVLYRIEGIIQLETVGTGFFVDIEGAVVGLVGIFARLFRERPLLQGIAQRIVLIHIRGRGIARDRPVRTFLDGQHRCIQRQHRSIVGTVDGDGDGFCHLRTVLVLDEDGEGLLQGRAVFSQFLHLLHLIVELIAVGTVRIDEEGAVLPGGHGTGVAACCVFTGRHGIAQIIFILAVVRDVELVPDRDGGILRGIEPELTIIDHRFFIGTRDGDVEIFLRAAVGCPAAVVHSDGQVKVRLLAGQQIFSFRTGREGIAAVLVQRELAPVGTVLDEGIGAGIAHFLAILGCQCDA